MRTGSRRSGRPAGWAPCMSRDADRACYVRRISVRNIKQLRAYLGSTLKTVKSVMATVLMLLLYEMAKEVPAASTEPCA